MPFFDDTRTIEMLIMMYSPLDEGDSKVGNFHLR